MNLPPGHTHHKGIERTVCPTQAGGLGSTKRDLLGCWWRVNNDTLVALLADCGKKRYPPPPSPPTKKTFYSLFPRLRKNFLLPLRPLPEKTSYSISSRLRKNFPRPLFPPGEKLPTPSPPACGGRG
ncbi:MAG: hypothetical protein KatS3mg110_3882 [Pirellulaceae bacterium]|nr:MAG: hypothetical protein KatS3mg110_3882 [Pirellulaceae bacterium]